MATYQQVVSMVLDFMKISSDDAYITEDHVKFLLDKYRIYVLKSKYADNIKASIGQVPSDSNYQTLNMELEKVDGVDGVPCTGTFLRSTKPIPAKAHVGLCKLIAGVMFGDNLIFVSPTRFRYVGTGRIGRTFNYAAIGADKHLYLRSGNPQLYYLEKADLWAIFENPEDVENNNAEVSGNAACDPFEIEFPLESNLLPLVMQYVVKELLGAAYRPQDTENNAADELSELVQFIRTHMKSPMRKSIDGLA